MPDDVKNRSTDPDLDIPPNFRRVDAGAEAARLAAGATGSDPGALPPPAPPEAAQPEKRGRGRPAKHGKYAGQKKGKSGAAPQRENPGAPAGPEDLTPAELAEASNVMIFGICEAIGGEVMKPSEQEFRTCTAGLAGYYECFPDSRPHPLVLLMGCYVGYFARRLSQPTVRDKIGMGLRTAWQRLTGLFKRRPPTAQGPRPLNLSLGERPHDNTAVR